MEIRGGQGHLTAKRSVTKGGAVETPTGKDGESTFQPPVTGWGLDCSTGPVVRKKRQRQSRKQGQPVVSKSCTTSNTTAFKGQWRLLDSHRPSLLEELSFGQLSRRTNSEENPGKMSSVTPRLPTNDAA